MTIRKCECCGEEFLPALPWQQACADCDPLYGDRLETLGKASTMRTMKCDCCRTRINEPTAILLFNRSKEEDVRFCSICAWRIVQRYHELREIYDKGQAELRSGAAPAEGPEGHDQA